MKQCQRRMEGRGRERERKTHLLTASPMHSDQGRDQDRHGVCKRVLIYEPENPEAKEFLTLIEEMLLMEEAQNREEESEEDSSGESEGESSEEPSEESSDECEDG
uniref:Glutamate rich 2 n=1 Tax=Pipistrellus kuhlii TaxID=59472 RepID=A0A7J7XU92_PIPKU|nr:glutamate rich 2 [Pipistrellus kuhlii]